MKWFGLLTLAMLVGCTNSMNPAPSANSNTDSTNGGAVTTNKPVVDEDGTVPRTQRPADEATRRDNTAVNTRDADSSAKTPLDQGQNTTDVTVTADIRKAIVNKSQMSINARNVKIITEKGHVTLRGPVDSQAEKDAIDKIAKERAGEDKVDNYLEIASGKPE